MNSILLLILSLLTDYLFDDPNYKLHPVRLIGYLISFLQKVLIRIRLNAFIGGLILLLLSNSIVVIVVYALLRASSLYNYFIYLLISVFLLYSAIGFRSLINYAKIVLSELKNNEIEKARKTVSNIVGRDVAYLNETGIIKATIESLSENFVDGFLSPVFWFAIGVFVGGFYNAEFLFGILLAYIYRTTNTLDSMVGYRTEQYKLFGKASARFDDFLNFIPARFTLLLIPIAAFLIKADYKMAVKIGLRDRLKHKSPNSAHAESTTAGALNVSLGGATRYKFGITQKEILGAEFNDATLTNLKIGIKLINTTAIITLVILILLIFFI